MQVIADRPEAASAIGSDLGAIFVSMELVWGFFCQAGFCGGGIFFLSSVSLFDLKPVSPPRPSALLMSARAGAVKVGRRAEPCDCSAFARPHLDSSEHGDTLIVVGMTMSRGARFI